MKTVEYKGFQASVEFEDGALFVRVLHIDDLLIAQIDAASEARNALKGLVDAYLDDCKELGKEPQRPFSGSFNVRVDRELHRRAAVAAAASGASLNAWVADAIAQKVDCDRFSDRVNTVLTDVRAEIKLLNVASVVAQEVRWTASYAVERGAARPRSFFALALPSDDDDAWGRLNG